MQAKPLYQNDQVAVYWDVPVYADHTEVQANRVDGRIVDNERKTVTPLEMSCKMPSVSTKLMPSISTLYVISGIKLFNSKV